MPRSRDTILPGSLTNAKCTICGEVFSNVSNFDAHREHIGRDKRSVCKNPEEVGLILSEKQIWITEQTWFKDE